MKKVFIVHGWDGYPEEGWFPWLKKQLEEKGFEVVVPQLPDAGNPHIATWVSKLQDVAGVPDKETYFVGHSMGCQTIARYLEGLPDSIKIGGVVFVAGFLKRLTGLENPEVEELAKEWLGTPIDLQKVKSHFKKSAAIFSGDDPYVPLDNVDDFKNILGSEIYIEPKKGHFSGAMDNCFELPVVLEAFDKIIR